MANPPDPFRVYGRLDKLAVFLPTNETVAP
jgi:hypothetical protein